MLCIIIIYLEKKYNVTVVYLRFDLRGLYLTIGMLICVEYSYMRKFYSFTELRASEMYILV